MSGAPRPSGGGVKNLLAMFEQNKQASPAPKAPGRDMSPKPLGRVKSDFVAVAKDGRFAGLQRVGPDGTPLSPATTNPPSLFGTPKSEEKKGFAEGSASAAPVPLVAPQPVKPVAQPVAKLEPEVKKEEPKEESKKFEAKVEAPKAEESKKAAPAPVEVKKESPKPVEVKKEEPPKKELKEWPIKKTEEKKEEKADQLAAPKAPSRKASPAPRQKTPPAQKAEPKSVKLEEPKKPIAEQKPVHKEANKETKKVTSDLKKKETEKTETKPEPKPILKAAVPKVAVTTESKTEKIAERKPERKVEKKLEVNTSPTKPASKTENTKPETPKLRVPANRMPSKNESKTLSPPKSPLPKTPKSPVPRSAARSPAPPLRSPLPKAAPAKTPTKATPPKVKIEPRKAAPPALKSPLKNSISADGLSTSPPLNSGRRHAAMSLPKAARPEPKTPTAPQSPRHLAAIKIPRPASVMAHPKGKSPTEVEPLPRASIYAPTASWIAKHMPDPLVRTQTPDIRRPITPSVRRLDPLSPQRRPATAASHRPTANAHNRRSMGTTLPAPDMTFLEKLMRPTQSSASKFEGKRELVERSRPSTSMAYKNGNSSRANSGSRGSSRARKVISPSTDDIPPVPAITAKADTVAWAAGKKRTSPEPLTFDQVSLAQALQEAGEATPKLRGPPESGATTEEAVSVDENHGAEESAEEEEVQSAAENSGIHEKEGEILSDSEITSETPAPAAVLA